MTALTYDLSNLASPYPGYWIRRPSTTGAKYQILRCANHPNDIDGEWATPVDTALTENAAIAKCKGLRMAESNTNPKEKNTK